MNQKTKRIGRPALSDIGRRALLVALAASVILVQPPFFAGIRTALLVPDLLVFQPIRPSLSVTLPPTRSEVPFPSAGEIHNADLYLPALASRAPAIVLILGVYPAPRDDPRVRRLGDGLARAGVAVMIPESTRLQAGTIAPEEVDDLVAAFQFLVSRSEVDTGRVGLVGLSVGGGLALLAAADPAIRDRVAYVQTVGAYFDAVDLFRAIAARSVIDPDRAPWEPSDIAVVAFRRQLIDSLSVPEERDQLERSYLAADPVAANAASLSAEARIASRLFEGGTPSQVDAWIGELPPATRRRLARLSPSQVVQQIRAPVIIMHDRDDPLVPVGESRRLAAALGNQARYRELRLFSHVVPAVPSDPGLFVSELGGLAAELFRWLRMYG